MYSVTILIDCRINYAMKNHIETGTLIFHSQLVSIKHLGITQYQTVQEVYV